MRIQHEFFAVRARANGLDAMRIAVSAPRSVGRAVRRNRARRRVREAFRAAIGELGAARGCDLVVVARQSAIDAGFGDVRVAAAGAVSAIARRVSA